MNTQVSNLYILVYASILIFSCLACDTTDSKPAPSHHSSDSQADHSSITDEETLSDLKALMSDRPDPKTLPDELKSDQVFPSTFDLVDLQTPVKSQGSRGVCSIFSTIALMEHLYVKKGAESPDFSEHFLQWSVKSELGRFTHTYGSNGSANISALNRYGVVEESVMPYQSYSWSTTQDERCAKDNEDKPMICYTNGEPKNEILTAKRWKLPPSRWINQSVQNLKAFMYEHNTGVVVGMKFFYQSWNHRKSSLPVSNEYKTQGYVLYPNEADREESLKKSAGHSILIVGWDDTLSVPILDKEGKQVLDEEGNPQMETGFFLFKNSWGTSAFGTRNPFGAGYGWLSMKYVEEYGSAVSAKPPSEDFKEVCNDGLDNNFDGVLDCEDMACIEQDVCRVEPAPVSLDFHYETEAIQEIPDEGSMQHKLKFEAEGYLTALQIKAEFDHTYPGDLELRLRNPQGEEVVLQTHDPEDTQRPLHFVMQPSEFLGTWAQGDWILTVIDHLPQDQGQLVKWSLSGSTYSSLIDFQHEYQSKPEQVIPDDDDMGVIDAIQVEQTGTIQSVAVSIDITHTYRGDLSVILHHPDGSQYELARREGRNSEDLQLEVSVAEWVGKTIDGEWSLQVIDHAKGDTGTLNAWSLEVLVFE